MALGGLGKCWLTGLEDRHPKYGISRHVVGPIGCVYVPLRQSMRKRLRSSEGLYPKTLNLEFNRRSVLANYLELTRGRFEDRKTDQDYSKACRWGACIT